MRASNSRPHASTTLLSPAITTWSHGIALRIATTRNAATAGGAGDDGRTGAVTATGDEQPTATTTPASAGLTMSR